MTARKLTGSILILLGIAIIVAAGVLRFSIAPGLTGLSENFNGQARLVGTLSSPNPDPAAGGAMVEVPLEADTSLTASSLSDDSGVVTIDTNTYTAPRTPDS